MEIAGISAGAGREVITPPVGTLLFGYRPDVVSTSVNDDLTVTAVMLAGSGVKAVLLSVTVCEVDTELSDALREQVGRAVGIPAAHVILSATHTHSGPITALLPGWGEINLAYWKDILIPRAVKAALTAAETLRPAKLGIGAASSDVGINRRQLNRDGSISLGQNPWGPYDPAMTVLRFMGLDGSPIVNLIHYCCHGTAAGCNHEISRDWSGPMVDCLERESGTLTVFFNGAEGDIGPRLPSGQTSGGQSPGNIAAAMALGAVAGSDAVRAYKTIREYRADVPLLVAVGDIRLPYRALPPREEVEQALAQYDGKNPESLINLHYLEYHRLKSIQAVYEGSAPRRTEFTFRQTLVAFGPVVLIPFPFEMFVEITLRLRAYSGYAHTLCLSNTNGANSYLPSQDQICRGGYEIRSFTSGATYCLTDDADNRIINANLDLLGE